MTDLVSIVMPSYNSARFLPETLASVYAQTYENWELLLVDDASTDGTEAILSSITDPRVRVFRNETNSGAAFSRNRALREAKGRWIAFLDADDLWLPEKLECQLAFMKKEGVAWSYTDYERVDEESVPLGILCTGPDLVTKKKTYRYDYLGCLTVMYDREVVGDIEIRSIPINNDYAMWLKVAKKADCRRLPAMLARYRVRKKSISHDKFSKKFKAHVALFRVCDERSPFVAFLFACRNMFFGFLKKRKYEKPIA